MREVEVEKLFSLLKDRLMDRNKMNGIQKDSKYNSKPKLTFLRLRMSCDGISITIISDLKFCGTTQIFLSLRRMHFVIVRY